MTSTTGQILDRSLLEKIGIGLFPDLRRFIQKISEIFNFIFFSFFQDERSYPGNDHYFPSCDKLKGTFVVILAVSLVANIIKCFLPNLMI
jgi:hypothetical protein